MLLGLTDSPGDLVGVSYLVRGARDLPRLLPVSSFPGAVAFLGPGTEAEAGFVGPAGDFNADGRADFLIGTGFSAQPGTVFLILGAPDFPKRVELATLRGRGIKIEGTIPSGLIEVHRETGDLDGDRVSDIALSERGLGSPQDVLGRVHVVFGVPKEAAFVRGDANFDGKVNISDAIFLGGPAPLCDDAADADDNGRLDITDAIRTLDALFLGTATLPAPYPEEGQDATQDSLRCLGF